MVDYYQSKVYLKEERRGAGGRGGYNTMTFNVLS